MTSSSPSGGRPSGIGGALSGLREVLDELRAPAAGRSTTRHPDRSDVRAAVLTVLAEQPADGYRIVRVLEERGHGARTPGAGAVYPTLQLLADEGLATATETDGRRVWTLTADGRAAAAAVHDRPAAPAASTARPSEHRVGIVRSAGRLAQAAALAAQTATPEQVAEVVEALDDARRRILSVLARS